MDEKEDVRSASSTISRGSCAASWLLATMDSLAFPLVISSFSDSVLSRPGILPRLRLRLRAATRGQLDLRVNRHDARGPRTHGWRWPRGPKLHLMTYSLTQFQGQKLAVSHVFREPSREAAYPRRVVGQIHGALEAAGKPSIRRGSPIRG